MGYTLPQIAVILAKADRTMYKIGSVAYNDMFNELDESLDYNRDIIYIYKVAVEYADNFYVGTDKLDAVVERLGAKIAVYDFGQLTPIYSNATIVTQSVPVGAALDDLSDVTITNVQNNQTLRYSSSLGQWINVGPGAAVRNRQQFTATLNQTVFVTTFPFESGLLDVYLNGVKLSPPSYTTFGNYTITLADGSLVDDIVEVIAYDPATSFIDLSGYVPTSRTLTINGVTYDLSANRTWTIDALPSQAGNTGKYLTTDGVIASWGAINLSGYVPYTGATATVDLGDNDLEAGSVFVEGASGTGGALRIKQFASSAANLDGYSTISTLNTGVFYFTAATTSPNFKNFVLNPSGLTDNTLRTYTLPNLSGTLALLSDITPGLTSVGLSMPSAFAVSNSPLTSNGTIAVTGAGTSAQYVRGDGQLANFPTNGGGGSSVNYYLNGSVTQGTFGGDTYYEMSKTPVLGAGTDFTRTNAQGDGYIASFITDAGDPSLLNIPGGNWNLEFYFQSSASGGSPQFYGEVYKVDASNNFTLVASGSTNPEGITNGTTVDQYFTSIPVPQTSLLVTDRLAIRIYVITSGRTITLHTEDGNLCEVLTTFSTGLNALNGLTAQVQYFATGTSGTDFAISSATDTHTFNLPTASATNRGALSSADWSTFSGKVGGSGARGQVAYWNGTSSQTGSNNLFWDSANNRLGINTNTPSFTLDVTGNGRFTSAINAVGADFFGVVSVTGTDYNHLDNDPTLNATANNQIISLLRFRQRGSDGAFTGVKRPLFYSENSSGGQHSVQLYEIGLRIGTYSGGISAFSNPSAVFEGIGTTASINLLDLKTNSGSNSVLVTSTGNLLLNGSVDAGQRLQVYGDAFIKGSGATSATTGLVVQDSAGTAMFAVRNDGVIRVQKSYINLSSDINNGIGASNDGGSFVSSGGGIMYATTNRTSSGVNHGFYGGNITNTSGEFSHLRTTGRPKFAPTSGTGTFSIAFLESTINQTGGANGITRGLYVNPTLTAAADWRSIEWSNNTGWGLYGAGTANNYLNGLLLLGSTTSSGEQLQVTGTAKITGAVNIGNATESVILANSSTIATANTLTIKSSAANTNTMFDVRPTGTANTLSGFILRDSETAATGSNVMLIGRGNAALPEAGVSYLGNLVAGTVNANSFHLGFLVSNVSLGRFEAMRMFNSGNVLLQSAGTYTDISSSKLTVNSTTQGFLPPRMTTTQKNSISSPAAGLIVYDTTLNKLCVRTAATWETITSL
jgi:hypothetical protein